ncbi:MAG: PEGA domain-containing protein [Pseudomonadota bacterium]
MIRSVTCVIASILLAACATTDPNQIAIDSMPSGALVQIDGFDPCETPCTVAQVIAPITAQIAKAGYLSQEVTLSPGDRVVVDLTLAAPTSDVDAVALPELD